MVAELRLLPQRNKVMSKETKVPVAPAAQVAQTTYDWSKTGVTGFEATRQEDMGIPFLQILQDLSPQIKKTDPNYATKKIEGAQPGDVINSLSNTIIYRLGGDPIDFVCYYHERLYVEWKAKRGGFVKAHKNATILNECTRNEDNENILRNGNVIMETSYFYGYAIISGEKLPCVIGMTSAGLKEARNWLNMMTSIRLDAPGGKYCPPIFSHVYQLSTVLKTKDRNAWMTWDIKTKGQLQDVGLITMAVEAAKSHAADLRKVLPPPVDARQVGNGDDVPFA